MSIARVIVESNANITGCEVTNNLAGIAIVELNQGPPGSSGADSITSATTSDGTGNISLNTLEVLGTLTANHIHGNLAGSVYAHVRAGEALAKGDPVYVSGSHGSGSTLIPIVSKADAANPAKMPAVGVMDAAVANNANGHMVITGTITEFNTDAYSLNAELYVANGGGLTTTSPAASSQPVGRVERVNTNNGAFIVKVNGWASSGGNGVSDANKLVRFGSLGMIPVASVSGAVSSSDPRLSDARTPLAHTHGNISNGGAIGTTSGLVVVTGTSGILTTQSRSGIDSRTSFPNDAVTAATADNVANTIVKRNSDGDSYFHVVDTQGLNVTETYYPSNAFYSYLGSSAATHRTALGLGTAATANSSAFATVSHTHGNITNTGAIGTTADLVVVTGASGALTTQSRSGIDSRTSFPNDDVTAATSLAVNGTIVKRDGSGSITITNLTVTGGTAYQVSASFVYLGSSAATHRTALGLTSLATTTAGTGVTTALAANVGSSGAFVVNGGALGTPSSGTLANATGLPISTGVAGLGSGVATFLATPTSANLAAAVTDETGSGSLVLANSPTLTSPSIAGTAAFTGTARPTSAATGSPAATDLITRNDGQRAFLRHLRSVVIGFDTGWTGQVTTGASVQLNNNFLRVEGSNGTAAGSATAHLLNRREGIGVSPTGTFAGIDFGNPLNINFAFRTRNFPIASSLNWAFLTGSLEPPAAGISNVVRQGSDVNRAWVGLQCINGNVTIIAVTGTSTVGQSSVIDTCVNGNNQKGYRLEVSGGTINCYSSSGVFLGSLSTNVPSSPVELSFSGALICVDSSVNTNQIGIIVQHLSFDW